MTNQELQELCDEQLAKHFGPHVRSLERSINRLKIRIDEHRIFHDGVAWLFEPDPEPQRK